MLFRRTLAVVAAVISENVHATDLGYRALTIALLHAA
jgi:hypothetical protein